MGSENATVQQFADAQESLYKLYPQAWAQFGSLEIMPSLCSENTAESGNHRKPKTRPDRRVSRLVSLDLQVKAGNWQNQGLPRNTLADLRREYFTQKIAAVCMRKMQE